MTTLNFDLRRNRNGSFLRSQSASFLRSQSAHILPPPTPCKLSRKPSFRKTLRRTTTTSTSAGFNYNNNYKKARPKTLRMQMNLNQGQIQFVNEGLIGKGSFSYVYKVRKTTTSKFYALKKNIKPFTFTRGSPIYHNDNPSEIIDYIPCLSEIKILKKIQSPNGPNSASFFHINLCKFRLFFFSDNRLHQIYELYPYGTLEQLIENVKLNSLQFLQVLLQLVNGLCYIHYQNIIHSDIKPENIYIDLHQEQNMNLYVLKIGDFGVATDISDSKTKKLRLTSGDPIFIAPEILNQIDNIHIVDESLKNIDVFALGVIMIQLLCDIKLPSQGQIFAHLRNIEQNKNGINWNLFFGDKMMIDTNDDRITCILKNEIVPQMMYKNAKNRTSSKELAIKMNQYFNKEIKQRSLMEFSKLKLSPTETYAHFDRDHSAMFSCDKQKINYIPIKSQRKMMSESDDDDDKQMEGDDEDGCIQKLCF